LQHLKVATKNAETKHAIFGLQSGPDHKHWLCFVYDETSDLKDCCSGWASLKEIWPDPKAFCPLVAAAAEEQWLGAAGTPGCDRRNRKVRRQLRRQQLVVHDTSGQWQIRILGYDRREAYTSNWVQYFI
jgi:hypothetical protein